MVEDTYEGVRFFLDSMLKEILNEEKWKNAIKERKLPDRFKKLPSFQYDKRSSSVENAWHLLYVANKEEKANILLYILDWLENLHVTPSIIRSVIFSIIKYPLEQRPVVFNWILAYFKDADDKQSEEILKELGNESFWRWANIFDRKQEHVKHNIAHLLDFIDRHQSTHEVKRRFIKYFRNSEIFKIYDNTKWASYYDNYYRYSNRHDVPIFLMNHGCDDLIHLYFKLIAFIYSDDFKLTRFIKEVIQVYHGGENCKFVRIQNMLIVFRDLK